MQRDTGPGERQQDLVPPEHPGQPAGMQGRIEQRRMQREPGGVSGGVPGQGHLGEDVARPPPGRPQPPEHRPVPVTGRRQVLIQATGINLDSALRRPHRELTRQLAAGRHGRAQPAAGMPRPRRIRVFGPRVHFYRPLPGWVRCAHRDLDLDRAAGGQHQRGFQGELPEAAAAGLVPGPDRELHERGAGQQHDAGHRVVGQPRLRLPGEPAGEHQPLARGQLDRRAEQRMPRRGQPRGGDIAARRSRSGRLRPVPLMLERVGGQVHPPPRAQHLHPVHSRAAHVHPGQGSQQPVRTAIIAAQRPGHHRGRPARRAAAARGAPGFPGFPGVFEGLGDGGRQHRMRGDLDEHPVPGLSQHPDRPGELHRRAQALIPVPGPGFRAVQELPGHRRDHRDPGRPRDDPGQASPDLLLQRLDLGAVRGVVHRQRPGPHAMRRALGGQLRQRVQIPRYHRGRRAVHRRHRQPPAPGRQPVPDRRGRLGHRDHPAPPRQRRQRPAAQRHHLRGVLQGQDPGHARGRDLPLGMARHRIRGHPRGLPHRGQGDHHRPQRRLHHLSPVQARRTVRPGQHLVQGPLHVGSERPAALGQPGP